MKILVVQSHPDYANPLRSSNRLAASGLTALREKFPDAAIDTLNLYAPGARVPRLDADFVNGTWDADKKAQQRALLDQFIAANLVFFFTPLHNFNVTARMKDYVDNLLIAGETFRYTSTGSVGLLDDSKRAILVLTSGSDYQTNFRYINMDLAPQYMRVVLSVMGINELTMVRAQGLDLSRFDREAVVATAEQELKTVIAGL